MAGVSFRATPIGKGDGLPLHITEVAQALLEGRKAHAGRWVGLQDADQRDVPPPLRLGSGQRHKETKSEGDDEPTVRRHMDVSSWSYLWGAVVLRLPLGAAVEGSLQQEA